MWWGGPGLAQLAAPDRSCWPPEGIHYPWHPTVAPSARSSVYLLVRGVLIWSIRLLYCSWLDVARVVRVSSTDQRLVAPRCLRLPSVCVISSPWSNGLQNDPETETDITYALVGSDLLADGGSHLVIIDRLIRAPSDAEGIAAAYSLSCYMVHGLWKSFNGYISESSWNGCVW